MLTATRTFIWTGAPPSLRGGKFGGRLPKEKGGGGLFGIKVLGGKSKKNVAGVGAGAGGRVEGDSNKEGSYPKSAEKNKTGAR